MFTAEELVLVEQAADRWQVLVLRRGRRPVIELNPREMVSDDPLRGFEVQTESVWLVESQSEILPKFEAEAYANRIPAELAGALRTVVIWPDHRVRWFISQHGKELP